VACEEELGSSIPTIFQQDITMIFNDAVRIRRSKHHGVLHTKTSISQYIPVYTSIYHVNISIEYDNLKVWSADLWVA
jgi:hypothetical protein